MYKKEKGILIHNKSPQKTQILECGINQGKLHKICVERGGGFGFTVKITENISNWPF